MKFSFFTKLFLFAALYGIFLKFGVGTENIHAEGWFMAVLTYVVSLFFLAVNE